ncbi:hypothetical protein A6R68_03095 [Neotoma lepida]|uniref:Uncharacterized protein n=1 Tax=Neotoma lepida TaxID=56216 RepID=A0A1A6GPZ2_NEOLE|nr:hypothetical protein A6R68_03095 [Neotoma lepida]
MDTHEAAQLQRQTHVGMLNINIHNTSLSPLISNQKFAHDHSEDTLSKCLKPGSPFPGKKESRAGRGMWHAQRATAEKRPDGLGVLDTNAGKGSDLQICAKSVSSSSRALPYVPNLVFFVIVFVLVIFPHGPGMYPQLPLSVLRSQLPLVLQIIQQDHGATAAETRYRQSWLLEFCCDPYTHHFCVSLHGLYNTAWALRLPGSGTILVTEEFYPNPTPTPPSGRINLQNKWCSPGDIWLNQDNQDPGLFCYIISGHDLLPSPFSYLTIDKLHLKIFSPKGSDPILIRTGGEKSQPDQVLAGKGAAVDIRASASVANEVPWKDSANKTPSRDRAKLAQVEARQKWHSTCDIYQEAKPVKLCATRYRENDGNAAEVSCWRGKINGKREVKINVQALPVPGASGAAGYRSDMAKSRNHSTNSQS